MNVTASPPKVERQEGQILISFSVGDLPIALNLTEGQARRIAKELLEALKETE